MSAPTINPDFSAALKPLSKGAGDFFLFASLYHAQEVSFGAAAALAGLGYEELHYRLEEHFGHGLAVDEEAICDDLRLIDVIATERC